MGRIFSGLPFKVRLLLLFDVRPTDPLILGTVSVVLTIVALLACLLPARECGQSRSDGGATVRVIAHKSLIGQKSLIPDYADREIANTLAVCG